MKTIISFLIILLPFFTKAQSIHEEKKNILYGIGMGATVPHILIGNNSSNLNPNTKLGWCLYSIFDITPKGKLDYFSKIGFSASKTQIKYDASGKLHKSEIMKVAFNISSNLIYKLNKNKLIPYLLTGIKYQIPLLRNEMEEFQNKNLLSINLGIGIKQLFKNNKYPFNPELIYSFGLNKLSNDPFLADVRYNTLTLYFNFAK